MLYGFYFVELVIIRAKVFKYLKYIKDKILSI